MQILGIILSLTTPLAEGGRAALVASLDGMPDVTVGPLHGHYLAAALEAPSRRAAQKRLTSLSDLDGVDIVHVTAAFWDQPDSPRGSTESANIEVSA